MKPKNIIISVIIIIILIIGFFMTRQTPQPVIENNEDGVTTTTPTEVTTSVYDGTYTGTFNYEYQDQDRFSQKVVTPWTPGSFTLTLTFKTIPYQQPNSNSDQDVTLEITNASISDPSFGTGASGMAPHSSFGDKSTISLPIDPSKREADKYAGFVLVFPAADYKTSYKSTRLEIKDGTIKVSSDGKTLSNDPNWMDKFPETKEYRATHNLTPVPIWTASTGTGEGTFRTVTLHTNNDRVFKYGSWSLTKTSQ